MKKYHIYLDQLNFFPILQEDFLGHLKLARLPLDVVRKLIILQTKVLTLIDSFKV